MKKLLIVAVMGVSFFAVSGKAHADPFEIATKNTVLNEVIKPPDKPPHKKQKQVYKIKLGDSLTEVARKYNTSWERLFYKNKKIKHPDMLEVGQRIVIPSKTEKLKKRSFTQVYGESPAYTPQNSSGGGKLIAGVLGYALPYGNCVNEPGVNNPGYGNPIDWPVLSGSPSLGATALWTFNHTGVVVGLWSNGDVEVRHQNYGGGQTRFPASAFRGYR